MAPVNTARRASDWAVHVALAVDGVASIGAVALPGLDSGMVLRLGPAAKALPRMAARPRFLVSRTRPAPEAEAVARRARLAI